MDAALSAVLALEGKDEEVTLGVFAEGGDVERAARLHVNDLAGHLNLAVVANTDAPDPARLVVAVDVGPDEILERLASVDIPSGDALAVDPCGSGSRLAAVGILRRSGLEIGLAGSAFWRALNGWNDSLMLQP